MLGIRKRGFRMKNEIKELRVTWGIAIRVWWSFFWRTTLFGLLPVFIIGILIGIYSYRTNAPDDLYLIHSQVLGLVIGIFVTIWVLKGILSKSYKGFRVVVIGDDNPDADTDIETSSNKV